MAASEGLELAKNGGERWPLIRTYTKLPISYQNCSQGHIW